MQKHINFLFDNWNNATKPIDSYKNELGFNTDENRLEFYIASLHKWFYLWSEFIAITESPLPPYFIENFNLGWFENNSFNSLFLEDFENNWFIDNLFSQLFLEDLETNWFTNNIFNQLFAETFEGAW
jgi:hypothetical protein